MRLTERQLRNIISRSIKESLNEIGDTPKGQYALGAVTGRAAARRGGVINSYTGQDFDNFDSSKIDAYKKDPRYIKYDTTMHDAYDKAEEHLSGDCKDDIYNSNSAFRKGFKYGLGKAYPIKESQLRNNEDNNQHNNRNMKQTIRLTESELRNYITEAVKRQLSEESYRKAAKKGEHTSSALKRALNFAQSEYGRKPKDFHKFADKYGLDKKDHNSICNYEDNVDAEGRPVNETESLEITRFREDIAECIEGGLEDMFGDNIVYTRDPNYIRINCPSDENVYAEVITRYHGMRQLLQF